MSSEHDQLDPDDSLDATLREFFAGTLNAQIGRAEREFQSHLGKQAKAGRRQRTLLILAFHGKHGGDHRRAVGVAAFANAYPR